METNYVLNTLFLVALGMLGLVSVGILYLSAIEWRDRRRRDRDRRGER
ncbi:hypothetical protein IQ249_12230 [Lusitaniella coriacea LEGE 07157]|uniref:Uncharacterized protein n=1 Tax=Lusitaniella coriacea LEGE 07157 TaxID=945747 RepID=A0A8J7DYD2_9CYAN|nr:hypothetical protein [Lusitaniella coriacea]MBE9116669.1 hypothetical protein [Lusitaniella coriacea LEGE 07157]